MKNKKKNFFMYLSEILAVIFLLFIILFLFSICAIVVNNSAQCLSALPKLLTAFSITAVLFAVSILIAIAKYCEISFVEAFVMVITNHGDFSDLSDLERLSNEMKQEQEETTKMK